MLSPEGTRVVASRDRHNFCLTGTSVVIKALNEIAARLMEKLQRRCC